MHLWRGSVGKFRVRTKKTHVSYEVRVVKSQARGDMLEVEVSVFQQHPRHSIGERMDHPV